MFSEERIREGYGDYRVSRGRPRVGVEDLKQSVFLDAFRAGVEFAQKEMVAEGICGDGDEEFYEDFIEPISENGEEYEEVESPFQECEEEEDAVGLL